MVNPEKTPRSRTARSIAIGLWIVLAAVFALWASLIWHPWIDWFGDPYR